MNIAKNIDAKNTLCGLYNKYNMHETKDEDNLSDYKTSDESEDESEFVCECEEDGENYCEGECECECEECDNMRDSVQKRSEWFDGFEEIGDSVYWFNESRYTDEIKQIKKASGDIDIIRAYREICHYHYDLHNNGFCNIDEMTWDAGSDEFNEPDPKKWPALAKLVKYTDCPMEYSMKKWVKCIDKAFDEIIPEAYKFCTEPLLLKYTKLPECLISMIA